MAKIITKIKEINAKKWEIIEQNEIDKRDVPLWNAILVIGGAIEAFSKFKKGAFVIKVTNKEYEKRVRTLRITETLSLSEKRDLFARILESFDYNTELVEDEMISNFYDSELFQDLEWNNQGEPVGTFRKDVRAKL